MPHLLWPFFNNNWPLFNDLFRCATRAMLRWARQQGIEVGIFCALLLGDNYSDRRRVNYFGRFVS
uniref:hypothetical protein n=1 Tax=Serratia liquefaciens TaxID=614 RepID=UPI0021B11605|nr:hypothetical protein [Serratia liquefaciens]